VGETVPETRTRGKRRIESGTVTSDKMDKTIIVAIRRLVKHPRYEKRLYRTTKVAAHDEKNEASEGDIVEIMETRPLSMTKRWRLLRVVKTAAKLG